MLVACSTAKSFRTASTQLGLNSSTVVRRIDRLEHVLGVRLFERLPDGIALTRDGRSIAASAQGMERALFDVIRRRDIAQTQRSVASISVTEGLGAYWIIPQLTRFQRQNPDLLVHVRCGMSNADVLRHEADLSIQFIRPENPDLKVVKLGKLNIYTYASPEYLRVFGTPQSPEDMRHHRFVNQVAPQLDDSAWARFLGVSDADQFVSISTNTSTAVLYAVEAGSGIGALPTYVGVLNPAIVPVHIGARHQIDIWLTYHRQIREDPRKAALIDWVRSIFDPKAHPYFSDTFMVPPDPRLKAPVDAVIPPPHPLSRL